MASTAIETAVLLATNAINGALLDESLAKAAVSAPGTAEAVRLISSGNYVACLSEPCVKELLGVDENTGALDPEAFFSLIRERVRGRLEAALETKDEATLGVVLVSGVAALMLFVQHNMAGPLDKAPGSIPTPSPVQLIAPHIPVPDKVAMAPGLGADGMHPHERWAAGQLALDGEDLVGLCSQLQYLLLARYLLVTPLMSAAPQGEAPLAALLKVERHPVIFASLAVGMPTWGWWAARVVSMHQSILSGKSATLLQTLNPLREQLVAWLAQGAASKAQGTEGESPLASDRHISSLLHIELAQMCYSYGHIEVAAQHLEAAGEKLGLSVELSGAMGKRTVHQIDAKAQLVVKAFGNRLGHAGLAIDDLAVNSLGLGNQVHPGQETKGSGPGTSQQHRHVEVKGLSDESDVFIVPQLVTESGEALESSYTGPEQALLLGWAMHVKRGTANDELQAWQMAPYVEAVLQQDRSQYMIQATAKLLKIRHDLTRSRTRERALMQMEQMVELMTLPQTSSPSPSLPSANSPASTAAATTAAEATATTTEAAAAVETTSGSRAAGEAGAASSVSVEGEAAMRLQSVFDIAFPLQVGLKKELAEAYVAMGIVGAAISIYEELELWDSLVVCYRLLQKKQLAEEVVQRQLKVHPKDPKLWCVLGDLHERDEHYAKAWELSGGRHARSKRSLGHSAMRRKEWLVACDHYKSSLALSPLYPSVWFSMGYAYIRAEEPKQALRAFSKVTQQEPNHAEAWNNIAAIWVSLKKPKEAFSALSECVKYKRDSWQVWENYSRMALESGNLIQAVRGIRQTLDLSEGQRLQVEVVAGLLSEIDNLALPRSVRLARGLGHPNCMQLAGLEENPLPESDENDDISDLVFDFGALTGPVAFDEGKEAAAEAKADMEAEMEAVMDERDRTRILKGVGETLKKGANSPVCSAEVWGLLGRYYHVLGELESEKEALLKQVRSLAGTAFKSDLDKFEVMAKASLALCRAYVNSFKAQAATASEGAPRILRDLSAARMHLRGVLKQCETAFGETELHASMASLLVEVEAEEKAAKEA